MSKKAQRHTPEPWNVSPCVVDNSYSIFNSRQYLVVSTGEYRQGSSAANPNANADRIVACVNALAGIEDPAGFVQAAKEALEQANYAKRYRHGEDLETLKAANNAVLKLLGGNPK